MTETEYDSDISSQETNVPFYKKGSIGDSNNVCDLNIKPIHSEDSNSCDGITEVKRESSTMSHSSERSIPSERSLSPNENHKLSEVISSDNQPVNCENVTKACIESRESDNTKDILSSDIFKFTEDDLSKLSPETENKNMKISEAELRREMFRNKLNKVKSADANFESSYHDIFNRIKHLINEDSENNIQNLSKFSPRKEDNISQESKRLTIDPGFERKLKEIFPASSMSTDHELLGSKNKDKIYVKRKDSSCEIIVENFSPVSATAKQLEQHLQFSSSSISPALIPRIPKLSRFARLNRFLSEAPEPQLTDDMNHIDS